ncbi:MAG TPA: lysophospholipid acyltransferase family protein [Actinomycetota bacterium]|nr:lysophospholipid acyltransferase family protein [Actinomycetota bacterium]
MADAEIIRIDAREREAAARAPKGRTRCRATTSSGRPCRNMALPGGDYCRTHTSSRAGEVPASQVESFGPDEIAGPGEGEESFGEFLRRRRSGNYEIDDFGYDPHLAREFLMPLMRPIYENYFRVKTLGVERIPDTGPALLVANHSGTVALDALIVQYAVASEHPQKRVVRNVGADLVFQLPFVGPLARKTGNAVACDEDAFELLRRGELMGVYPEGYKGVGKGWRERYKLQRFGRGGFMEIALRTRVPIIPIAVVGAEEAYPMIADAKFIARTFGFPYFPITPTFPLLGPLGMIPLPSKWLIEFGDPIPMDDYPDDAAEDAMLVFDLADRVRDTIQQMLYRNLARRKGVFF